MGWTCIRSERGESTKSLLARNSSYFEGSMWTGGSDGSLSYCIEKLQPGKGGLYGILRKHDTRTGKILRLALVIAIERKGGRFCWKSMTEFCGPVYHGMPAHLLRQLSPLEQFTDADKTTVEYARAWRETVAKKVKPLGITVGSILEFVDPVVFKLGNRIEVYRFEVLEWGRRRCLKAFPTSGAPFLCHLRRSTWENTFSVIAPV